VSESDLESISVESTNESINESSSIESITNEALSSLDDLAEFSLSFPAANDENLAEGQFLAEVDQAWQVCDRFDLQTDIWRGKILRTVRDREKANGEGRGTGFLKWLQEREIS
jgi:hypothetical protein